MRFRQIEGRGAVELELFVAETIEEGSTVITDGLKEYGGIVPYGYKRAVQIAGRGGVTKADVLKHFHLAVSNLKAWLMGTHHGAVSKKHLQAYLSEYAFRFNRRGNLYAAFARVSYGDRPNSAVLALHFSPRSQVRAAGAHAGGDRCRSPRTWAKL